MVERFFANSADCAGHHRDAVPPIVSASIKVETAGVFERLTTRDERAQVSYFRVTRHRADTRIGKRLEQSRQRVALTLRVGIDKNHNAATDGREGSLQSAGFSPVLLLQQTHTWVDSRNALDFGGGLVARSIIDHDRFNVSFVIGR